MKILLIAVTMFVVSCVALEGDELHAKWLKYKMEHSKTYKSELEDQMRKKLWQDKMKMVEEHNKKYEAGEETYTMGMNHLSDWTKEELKRLLNLNSMPNSREVEVAKPFLGAVPESWDWRNQSAVNPVKDQGYCGSCWAFAAVAALEFQYWKIKNHTRESFSEQQLVDCMEGIDCDTGGWYGDAFDFLMTSRLETTADYPYVAETQKCMYNAAKGRLPLVASYKRTTWGDENEMKKAVYDIGVISTSVDVQDEFFSYSSGVFSSTNCDTTWTNHAIAAVGYGTTADGKDYWIIRNSWGSWWGEGGYIKVARNKGNTCGIASWAYYPTLQS